MEQEITKKRIRKLAWISAIAVAICGVLTVLAFHNIRIPCLFHELTGLLCPGCGNTRAVIATLRLDLAEAFRLNPLYLVQIAYIGWVCVHAARNYVKTGRFSYPMRWKVLDITVLALMVIWGVLRNII